MFFGSPEHLKFLRYEVLSPQRRCYFYFIPIELYTCVTSIKLSYFLDFTNKELHGFDVKKESENKKGFGKSGIN